MALCAALGMGCGYHLVHGSQDPEGPFRVEGGEAKTPYATAMAAAEQGAETELARAGALAAGAETVMVVEILRIDEISEAMAASGDALEPVPRARALRVTVTGRATLKRHGAIVRDTRDMRAAEVIAAATSPTAAILAREEAAVRASRRLGEQLARRLLGYPAPSEP